MEWTLFKENKPKRITIAVVCNVKGWMTHILAIYYPEDDVWVLLDPKYRQDVALEVTHYIEIPDSPKPRFD